MEFSLLTALSPLDGRYSHHAKALKPFVSEYGLNHYRLQIEIKWLQMLSSLPDVQEVPPFSSQEHYFLNQLIENYNEQDARHIKMLEATTNHDVKAVEYFLKEKLSLHPTLRKSKEFVHFACTSEDINNLSYGLMLKDIRKKVLLPLLSEFITELQALVQEYAHAPMLARTHGQPASPTTMGKELANVNARLVRQAVQFEETKILGKINGAVGNFNAHAIAYPLVPWETVAKQFVESLGLFYNPFTTQIEPHDAMAEYFHCLIRINTILIDFCRDIWGYIALGFFKQKTVANEIGSSTMPHKVNPIDFENAEGNLGLANALFTHFAEKLPISRWQRDLSDSTVLRNIGVAAGYTVIAFSALLKGLSKLTLCKERLAADLNENWEVLGEAIQTVMRRFQIPEPYEKVKTLTRGKKLTAQQMQDFVQTLPLPEEIKQQLIRLTPERYTGLAGQLIESMEEK